jgi:hypothetical protein
MRKLLESATRGTTAVFERPGVAAAFYVGAVVAVIITTGLRPED